MSNPANSGSPEKIKSSVCLCEKPYSKSTGCVDVKKLNFST
jgi:hypothetical protein